MYKANNKIDELLEKNLNISYSKSESENSILSDKIDLAKTKNDKVLKKENEDRQEERKLQNEGNAKKNEETRVSSRKCRKTRSSRKQRTDSS